MKASELLSEASTVLGQGWVQGQFRTPEGFCLMGALKHADCYAYTEEYVTAVDALADRIVEYYPHLERHWDMAGYRYTPCIPTFNDSIARSRQEVIDMLDKARVGLEERGL